MMGAGLRPSGKPLDEPPYAKMQTRCISIPTHRRRVVKLLGVVKTRDVMRLWDKSVGCLVTGQTATGVKGA
jgi:hypothetical protein